MNWNWRSSQPDLGIVLARWIANFRRDNTVAAMNRDTFRQGMPVRGQLHRPRTAEMPEWFAIGWADLTLVLLDGATILSQGTSLMNAYGNGDLNRSWGGIATELGVHASSIQYEMRQAGIYNVPRIIVAGHSLGGCIGNALASLIAIDRPYHDDTFVTFAAPRTGGSYFQQQMRGKDVTRWMNSEDPVPLLPPRLGICPTAMVGRSAREVGNWNLFDHLEGGKNLDINGEVSDNQIPPDAIITPTTSLASWLVSLPFAAASVHSIETYRARLERFIIRRGPLGPPLPTSQAREERTHTSGMVVQRAIDEAAESLYARAKAQQTPRVVIPREKLFIAHKEGMTWVVSFGGQIISLGPDRRRATRFASKANAMLAVLQRQGNVDPDAFAQQFAQYMLLASDPTSGFTPQMNTTGV